MSGLDYAARAAAGAAFLDEHMPGWAGRIDLGTLDMAGCRTCILGQLTGDYCRAADDLAVDLDGALAYGFTRLSGTPYSIWDVLREAWTAEVRKRREPAEAGTR